MLCVQLYGKWARWGRYNLYIEALHKQNNICKASRLSKHDQSAMKNIKQ